MDEIKAYITQNRDLIVKLKQAVDKYTNLRFNQKNTNEYEIISHRKFGDRSRKLINPLILYSDKCYLKEKCNQSKVTIEFKLSFNRLKMFLIFLIGSLSLFFFFLDQRIEFLLYLLLIIPFYFGLKRKTERFFGLVLKKLDQLHPV